MNLYVPENLDVRDLFSKKPFEFVSDRNYSEDIFYYLINLLYTIPARNKKILTEDDYVPLDSSKLNSHCFGYRKYLDYLLETGVIETDNHYITEEDATNSNPVKLKGYRLKPEYMTRPRVLDTESRVVKRAARTKNRMSRRQKEKYNHLIKWLKPALKIEEGSARAYLENWYEAIKDSPEKWGTSKKGIRKDPKNTLLAGLVGIDLLKRFDFKYTVDSTSRRFHSNLTNLKKELRHFITYEGHRLVGIDLKNSQPFLSLLLIQEGFWNEENEHLSVKDIGQNGLVGEVRKIQLGSKFSRYHMLDKLAVIQASKEFQLYQFLVTSGELYNYLYSLIRDDFDHLYQPGLTSFKLEFIKSLYAGNQYSSIVKRQFKELFPRIHDFFSIIKRHKNERLSIILQSIESSIFLLRITKRIGKEMPWLPIYTIHDNIVTVHEYGDHVLRIAQEELTKCVGITPQFGKEEWNPRSLPEYTNLVNLYN